MKVRDVEEASLRDVGTRRHTICDRGEMMKENWSRRDELANYWHSWPSEILKFKNV